MRSPESIHASRMVGIIKWRDEQHKEKSRFVVKDFANTRDPTGDVCSSQRYSSGKSG